VNIAETVELLHALKSVGATHFKSNDIEVRIGGSKPAFVKHKMYSEPPQPELPVQQEEAFNPEATKRAEDLINLLKMKDDQLVDQIFPDGAL
jgi:hypothetical protein